MLIVPPDGLQHLVTSSVEAMDTNCYDVCIPVREGMLVVDANHGGKAALRIACGAIMPSPSGSYGPLQGLTRSVVENLSGFPVVASAFAALFEEVAGPRAGTRPLTSALMKACLVVVLRQHLEAARIARTAPAVFQDSRLSRAVAAILNLPAADHSLSSLAK